MTPLSESAADLPAEPSLFTLLIDDAAVFPPGLSPLPAAVREHRAHRASWYAALIGPLLVPASAAEELGDLVAPSEEALRLSLVARPGTGLRTVTDAVHLLRDHPTIDLAGVEMGWAPEWRDVGLADLPLTLEVPRGPDQAAALADVALDADEAGELQVKFRTGATPQWDWPAEGELASFLGAALKLGLAFKLTGGLHHAVRGTHTVGSHAEEQHGLLNVICAVRAALHGASPEGVEALLAERDPEALVAVVSDLDSADATAIRTYFTAYGCCGVTDPVSELHELNLIEERAESDSHRLDIPEDHPFGLANLPYGVFSTQDRSPRIGVRIGDWVLDAGAASEQAGMESGEVWLQPSLNAFLAEGRPAWRSAREWLTELLTNEARRDCVEPNLVPVEQVSMHLPIEVADYVDFYASEHHATNVGRIFRPDSEPLTPNWKHLPIGYHGRAGTVVVSGTDIIRPTGQRKAPADPAPSFGPSVRLDIEAELGFVVGGPTPLGERVGVAEAADHLLGVVLLNDWSARDIQAWEYVPLGPFLGKSFATSISPWVVTLDALEAAHVPLPGQDPPPLPYLQGDAASLFGLDIHYEVELNGTVVARPEYRDMYWSPSQMLAHLTVNGASLRAGDLFGSGTISGAAKESRGSFLELSWNGSEPVALDGGGTRAFLEDGDVVTLRAWAPGPDGARIGLGEVTGTVRPAR